MSNVELTLHFFTQVAVILACCRGVGLLMRRFGQPQVIGEMIAGILMGPSVLGALLPDIQRWVFPAASKGVLYVVSQLGLVLYMFLVGLTFDISLVRARIRSAAAVSIAGMLAPFGLGGLIALLLGGGQFFSPSVQALDRVLFLGAAMAVTAFPVLARIVYERGLSHTAVGTLALASGSIDDASAWCILAVVLASFGNSAQPALLAIGGTLLYLLAMLQIGRPLLRRLDAWGESDSAKLAVVLMLLVSCATFTDAIGIHAVFGAFTLGALMPRGRLTQYLTQALEPITTVFLVPLYFIYSGLNTQINLVTSPLTAVLLLLVVLAACLGKFGACWLAARLSGESNRAAAGIGALMNARGLMELIMLNIGLERGIITPTLFTIMVLMAIITTLMAIPSFNLVYGRDDQVGLPVGNVAERPLTKYL
jgi:Kef-type K+ transport system membrane component KefB